MWSLVRASQPPVAVGAGWADTETDWKQGEWLGPEGGDKQCKVQLEAGKQWCTPGVRIESINHLHDRVWYTLSEFADDTELGGVADRSSRWDGCHPEGDTG